MIILVRHAQSEGNKDRDIHQFIPDHRVKLTAQGWNQARLQPYEPHYVGR
jgi:broad specificity phosphatase PhoE